jgi:tRNA pseudouridine38-40 synthase
MRKYKITLEYDGTNYNGWQSQKNAKSIQATILRAAEMVLGETVEIQGAGRTDAGVHALAQVAHLETSKKISPQKLLFGLNDHLPASINILHVKEVPLSFHARHHAIKRSYIYLISKERTAFGKKYVWWVKDTLDLKNMRDIYPLFSGFHDFVSFADKRRDKNASTLVKIEFIEVKSLDALIVFRIVASHFLWKMVRRIVGILVEAGRGNLSRRDVEQIFISPSDVPARYTAPPSGLFLEKVFYEGDALKPLKLPMIPFFPDHRG